MKRRKNGIILLVTIMLLMLLMGVMTIFLKKTTESKNELVYAFALNQTNLLMHNIFQYIKAIELDEESIFYASKTSYPLDLGDAKISINIDSAQKNININSMVTASIKNNIVADRFLFLLSNYKLKRAQYLLALLQDTVDKDSDDRSGDGSEIIIDYPTFRNGSIYNQHHLEKILDYYFIKTGDENIYNIPFEKMFSYENSSIDLNFISLENLNLLFPDANGYTLKLLGRHVKIYEKLEDLPFDEYYTKKLNKNAFGQPVSLKTENILVNITLKYKAQFVSKVNFEYNLKAKKIIDYHINSIELL